MTAIEIITLSKAKTYLAMDDDSRDAEITRMIGAALRYVEERTNHILVSKDKTFNIWNGCARIYDHPITSEVPEDITETDKGLYKVWSGYSTEVLTGTATFGYTDIADIPEDLLEAAYLMLKFFFFEQEGNGRIPMAVEMIIDANKRFIV